MLILITKVNAHAIRAVATSLRFKYNMDQIEIIKSAYWRSNSIHCSRYLLDPTHSYLMFQVLYEKTLLKSINLKPKKEDPDLVFMRY